MRYVDRYSSTDHKLLCTCISAAIRYLVKVRIIVPIVYGMHAFNNYVDVKTPSLSSLEITIIMAFMTRKFTNNHPNLSIAMHLCIHDSYLGN